jgi:hypothetical protein
MMNKKNERMKGRGISGVGIERNKNKRNKGKV